jgi:8-oxo-dGTP pyrophosphatase MutT (NUDIX family)/phosphohistidine phosphatase SixA
MADGPAAGEIRAAGALLWRSPDPGRRWRPSGRVKEVALIHRPKYDDWTFPKGKRDPGEHVLLTAVREVAEETGLSVVLGRPLTQARYDQRGRPKRVDYWVARSVPGSADSFQANDEVDGLEWLPVPAARSKLSYPHDAEMLDEFTAAPADTVPFVLLRHASAGGKDAWKGDDLDRPLDADGAAESDLLARLLACYGTCRVITSAAERCVATVRPYAALTGAKLEVEPALAVGVFEDDPEAGPTLAAAAVAAAQPTVICAHRENIPPLLAAASAALGAEPPDGPPLRKAGFWVLHSADGAVIATEQHSAE